MHDIIHLKQFISVYYIKINNNIVLKVTDVKILINLKKKWFVSQLKIK